MVGNSLEKNLKKIKDQIVEACMASQRDPQEVQLIAVSKTKPIQEIRAAYDLGQIDFGENYAQELEEKAQQLQSTSMRWHFIGPLQTNKVKKVIGVAQLIHSVDRFNLAQEISRVSEQRKIVQDILVQVNVAGEGTKSGISIEELPHLMQQILALKSVRPVGLMTMPPMAESHLGSRKYFQILNKALNDLKEQFPKELGSNFKHLSMGTSQDFVVAIEEGATYIRVGTQIFGERTFGARSS